MKYLGPAYYSPDRFAAMAPAEVEALERPWNVLAARDAPRTNRANNQGDTP
jgi:hypothetical protein